MYQSVGAWLLSFCIVSMFFLFCFYKKRFFANFQQRKNDCKHFRIDGHVDSIRCGGANSIHSQGSSLNGSRGTHLNNRRGRNDMFFVADSGSILGTLTNMSIRVTNVKEEQEKLNPSTECCSKYSSIIHGFIKNVITTKRRGKSTYSRKLTKISRKSPFKAFHF